MTDSAFLTRRKALLMLAGSTALVLAPLLATSPSAFADDDGGSEGEGGGSGSSGEGGGSSGSGGGDDKDDDKDDDKNDDENDNKDDDSNDDNGVDAPDTDEDNNCPAGTNCRKD